MSGRGMRKLANDRLFGFDEKVVAKYHIQHKLTEKSVLQYVMSPCTALWCWYVISSTYIVLYSSLTTGSICLKDALPLIWWLHSWEDLSKLILNSLQQDQLTCSCHDLEASFTLEHQIQIHIQHHGEEWLSRNINIPILSALVSISYEELSQSVEATGIAIRGSTMTSL